MGVYLNSNQLKTSWVRDINKMKHFLREVKLYIKFRLNQFKKSRFLLSVACLTIGATSVIIFYEGKPLYDLLTTTNSIEIVNASYEVVPEIVGESVKAESLQENNPIVPNKNSVEEIIAHFFKEDAKVALAVAMCESSLDPSRIGDTHLAKPSVGLFQINQIWHPYTTEQLQDAEFNVKIAKEIVDNYGWSRWTCFKSEGYKKFLIN